MDTGTLERENWGSEEKMGEIALYETWTTHLLARTIIIV